MLSRALDGRNTRIDWRQYLVYIGFVGLFLRLTNNWRALEKVTADSWMMKWAGKNVYEKMWKPLLVGKFGPFYRDVNMAWMWARIKALGIDRKKIRSEN